MSQSPQPSITALMWIFTGLLIVHSCCVTLVQAEIYTALAEMEELLDTETVLIANLEAYISTHEKRLQFLRSRVQIYQREHNEASADITTYLSNPINAYLLTKRLTSDWRSIEDVMSFDVGGAFLENVTDYRNQLKFPSDEDLNGAAAALTRLQDTYKLDTASIARGQLNGIQYSSEMSTNDCFELGRQSYVNGDYYHTALWMNEAMARLANDSAAQTMHTTRADILEYLAYSVYRQGNVLSALQMTNELLELLPQHERALGNKVYYESEIRTTTEQLAALGTDRKRGDDGSPALEPAAAPAFADPNRYDTTDRQQYERLCRNELGRSAAELAPLRCRYVTNRSAFLRIGPLKLEEANLSPYIVVYHEVLFDSEIETIKQMAKPKFERSRIQNHKTGQMEVANYRISKTAWLKNNQHEYVERISRRVEDMTGLTTATAEELQVVNYGIGGHYEPHFDFAHRREDVNTFKSLGTGNRIATVLFYMTDVEEGGSTVFPMLNVALQPRKGTAAFWMNLYTTGVGDMRTRHAACPVLIGSKWVCNKWLHEAQQDRLRPCNTIPDHPAEA